MKLVVVALVVVIAGSSWASGAIPAGIFPLVGGSTRGLAADYPVMKALGSNGGRVYCSWSYIERNVTTSLKAEWTLAYVQAHADEVADEWAASVSWAIVDPRVANMAGVVDNVVLQLGGGFTNSLPYYKDALADPNVIGTDQYLAYMFVYSYAAAKRYVVKNAVHLYQIENELNEAYLASLAGQRYRGKIVGSAWADWAFLTQLLEVLKAAAYGGHAAGLATMAPEDAAAVGPPLVTQNVHSDVPKWVHTLLHVEGYYEDAIESWHSILDWVSMDAYPNMFIATPCLADIIGQRIATAVGILKAANDVKPVMIMETNYPSCGGSCNASTTYPAAANFTLANQATCMAASVDAVFANGGEGFFFFTVAETKGITPPPGGYSAEDLSALNMLANLYEKDGNPLIIAEWLLGKNHLAYLESARFADMLGNIVGASGAMDMDGTLHPVVAALAAAYARHR